MVVPLYDDEWGYSSHVENRVIGLAKIDEMAVEQTQGEEDRGPGVGRIRHVATGIRRASGLIWTDPFLLLPLPR